MKKRWLRINRDGTKIDPGQQAEQPQPTDEPQTDDSKAKDVADGEGVGNEGEDEEEVVNQGSISSTFLRGFFNSKKNLTLFLAKGDLQIVHGVW